MHPNLRTITLSPSIPMLSLTRPIRRLPIAGSGVRSIHATAPLRFRCTAPLFTTPIARRNNALAAVNAIKPIPKRSIAYTAMSPDGAMFSHPAPEPGMDFNVVMIGAGVRLFLP
jgi:hypothetical protein